VVGSPLVHQGAVARQEAQQHPARAARQRLAHRDELGAPALDAAEIGVERECHGRRHRPAVGPERGEVELVQQHRVGRNELLALESV